MKYLINLSILLSLSYYGCKKEKEAKQEEVPVYDQKSKTLIINPFVDSLEYAHQKKEFLENEVISFDILIHFGGKERLNARMNLSTDSRKGRIDLADGNQIYYVDEKVYYSPDMEKINKVRFDAYTWSYFFLLPYKLSDKGVQINDYEVLHSGSKDQTTKRLNFNSNTGDTPDDWYILYKSNETQLLSAAAYIVSANKTKEQAEEDPHVISYSNYKDIDGIPIAHKWTFSEWRENEGFTKLLGSATLSNINFSSEASNDLTSPTLFKEIK
jgi:hypothetical protein